jgi:hypothetical protein
MSYLFTKRYWKRSFRLIWKVKWWYLPLAAISYGLRNEVVNGGSVTLTDGHTTLIYYFGLSPAFWGILLGVFLGVFWNKARATGNALWHSEAWALQEPKPVLLNTPAVEPAQQEPPSDPSFHPDDFVGGHR